MGQLGHANLRLWINSDYRRHFPLVATTQQDGTVEQLNIPYLDIRFSNLCNFHCRICSPCASDKWYIDAKQLGRPECTQSQILTPTADPDELWRQLEPLVPNVEKIYFAGGEPLIMEQNYRLLNLLIEKKLFHIKLVYNTNFSIMQYNGQDIMQLWDKFQNVNICASLDALGRRGEYLRKGQNWEQVIQNRERMFSACPRTGFEIIFTLSIMNAMHLPDFHKECVEKGHIKPDELYVNILFEPEEYCVQLLPQHLKKLVAEKYQRHIAEMSGLSDKKKADFMAAISFMLAQDKTELLEKFRERTLELDQMRGECFTEVFPELAELMTTTNQVPAEKPNV